MEINTNRLSPKNDYLFKKLFTSKGNEDILCDFISAIIGRKVVHATIQMEKMLQQERENNKYGRLDIEVTLKDGSKIDVEMQRCDEVNHIKRTVYYAGKLLSEQLQIGEAYDKLKPVEIIYITDFNFLKSEHYKTSTVIVDELNRREVIINELRFHYIELNKFRK
ncbi:MAG: Rpn family recombination-promoting nuclease/putative transposase [Clostridia bacterium]|nr:Rpn family recombination-promoting nuclease/putative transposase [Clostridia bacterium]